MRIASPRRTADPAGLKVGIGRCGALLLVVCLGCGVAEGVAPLPPPTPPAPKPGSPTIERYGSIQVTTETSGADVDPDGFIVRTDGEWDYTASPTPIATNGTVTIKGVAAGPHSLTLLGVAQNCRGANLNDRPIVVTADTVTAVVFELVCKHR